MSLSRIALFALLATASTSAIAGSYQPIDNGVVVTPDAGAAKRVRVIAYGDDSFRVTAVPTGDFNEVPESLMVNAKPAGKPVVTQSKGSVTLKLPGASAVINLASGQVSFLDRTGKAVLTESGRSAFRPRDVEGKRWFTVSQQFNPGTDEGFYGLGQHQNGQMNYNGEDVELAQHNMAIAVPYVVSTRGYGLLWDNDGITRFGNPRPYEFVGKDLKVTSDGKPGCKAEYFLGKSRAALRQEDVIERGDQLNLLIRRLLIGQSCKHAFQRNDGLANGFQPFDAIRLGRAIAPEQGVLERDRQAIERHQTNRGGNPTQGMSRPGHLEGSWRDRIGIERGVALQQGLQVAARLFEEDVVERLGCGGPNRFGT